MMDGSFILIIHRYILAQSHERNSLIFLYMMHEGFILIIHKYLFGTKSQNKFINICY